MNWVWLDTAENHEKWGVVVKPSLLLKQKELGLFAIRDFHQNEKIAPYLGEQLTLEQRRKRYGKKWGPYVYFKPWGHPSIDALFYRGAAAFANDGVWCPSANGGYNKNKYDQSNVYLANGWLIAKQNITSGSELLLDYGESYWKNRFPIKDITHILKEEHPKLIYADK